MPMAAYDGSSAMKSVAAAMSGMTKVSVHLRPFLSPSQPKMIAPSGRAAKPRPNAPNVPSMAAKSSPVGNITLAMTVARNAYVPKSNHSRILPTTAAVTARLVFDETRGLSLAA